MLMKYMGKAKPGGARGAGLERGRVLGRLERQAGNYSLMFGLGII